MVWWILAVSLITNALWLLAWVGREGDHNAARLKSMRNEHELLDTIARQERQAITLQTDLQECRRALNATTASTAGERSSSTYLSKKWADCPRYGGRMSDMMAQSAHATGRARRLNDRPTPADLPLPARPDDTPPIPLVPVFIPIDVPAPPAPQDVPATTPPFITGGSSDSGSSFSTGGSDAGSSFSTGGEV